MADLDNLDDFNNDNDTGGIGSESDNDEFNNVGEGSVQFDQQYDDDGDEYGAGDEERNYQGGRLNDDNENEPQYDEDGNLLSDEVINEDDEEDDRNYNADYEQLKGLWTSELACPELLPADGETIEQIVDDLTKKEEMVEDLLSRSQFRSQQQQTSKSRRGGSAGGDGDSDSKPTGELASLVAQITKMDMDRARFMVVDLARTRMAKIENHALHNRTLVDRMTEEEIQYLRQYGELLEKHYRRTVLNQLPKENWKKLDDPEMIDTPDLEQFVFCRVLETVNIDVSGSPNTIYDEMIMANDQQQSQTQDDEDELGGNMQEHQDGSYLIVMYKTIRDLVLEGKVELLM